MEPDRHHEDLLVDRAVDGDHLAFAELLKPHDRKLRALVWRLNAQDDIDDIMQEAYLKAHRSLPTFDAAKGARLGSWLWRVVHSTCIDHHRRSARQPQTTTTATLSDFAMPATDVATRVVLQAQLRDALAQLPPAQSTVIALADGEGMSYDEIATLIDVSPGTVASRLNRARSALRELLRDNPLPTTTNGASR